MRAFTITLVVAMLGAISLATTGAVWTLSQTRQTATAFGLAGDSAPLRNGYRRQPVFAAVATRVGPADMAHDGAAPLGAEGGDR
jgi:hypothetical protein